MVSKAPIAHAPRDWRRVRAGRVLPVCLLAVLAASGAAYFRPLLSGNNLHVVLPGQIYRSAQPSAQELDRWITQFGLCTVVSLRGGKDHWEWFAEEKQVCRKRNVELHAAHFDPNRLPPKGELGRLVEILDAAPRPLLLHCSRGIDRTGLAAAVAELLAGSTPEQAMRHFGLKFGFFAPAGHSDLPQVLSHYESWLRGRQWQHSPDRFRQWVHQAYVPYFYHADIRLCDGCGDQGETVTADRALQQPPLELSTGPLRLHFRLTNTSPEPWHFRSTKDHGVHLGLIVERADATPPSPPYQGGVGGGGDETGAVLNPTDRLELRAGYQDLTVAPGESTDVHAVIPPISSPGRYRVTVDLVDESVTWFADMGSPSFQFELQVFDTSVAGL